MKYLMSVLVPGLCTVGGGLLLFVRFMIDGSYIGVLFSVIVIAIGMIVIDVSKKPWG